MSSTDSTTKRPNILFAIADDASHMSAYGHKFVHTPNFDRVARSGVLLRECVYDEPEMRAFTGQHPGRHAHLADGGSGQPLRHFSRQICGIPDLLEQAGYFVGYTGEG